MIRRPASRSQQGPLAALSQRDWNRRPSIRCHRGLLPWRLSAICLWILSVLAPISFGSERPQETGNGIVVRNFAFRASDGVEIGATLYKPAAAGSYPAIIFGHGFNQSRFGDQGQTRGAAGSAWTGIPAQARWYARDGYVVLAVDSRYEKLLDPGDPDDPRDDTFLKPGGQAGLNNSREIRDHMEQIDWLIRDPDRMIAPARVDPAKIGMSGYSYEANQSMLTAAHDSRLKAIAVHSGWTDYLTVKFPGMSGIQRGVPEFFQLAAPLVSVDLRDNHGRGNIDPTWFEIFLEILDHRLQLTDLWFRKAGVLWQPYRFRAAVFLSHAWNEFLIPADQPLDLFRLLPVPKKIYIGGWGHPPSEAHPDEGRYVLELRRQFFDHWLKGEQNEIMDRPVEFAEIPWSANVRDGRPVTRSFTHLPMDQVEYRRLYLRSGGRLLAEPPIGREPADRLNRRADTPQADWVSAMRRELEAGIREGLREESLSSLRKLFRSGASRAWSPDVPPGVDSITYVSDPLDSDWQIRGTAYLDVLLENEKLNPLEHNNNLSVRWLAAPPPGPGRDRLKELPQSAAGEALISYGFYGIEVVESKTRREKANWVHASVSLMPTNVTIPKGSRLVLKVSGCDFPNTFPCLGESTTRLHHSPESQGNEGFEAGYPGLSFAAFPVVKVPSDARANVK